MKRLVVIKLIFSLGSSLLLAISGSSLSHANLPNLTQITTGFAHTCALNSAGEVYCWGNNEVGQVGNGLVGSAVANPSRPKGLSSVKMISAGAAHNCAIENNGDVFCWGQNDNGKLGTGVKDQSTTPVKLSGIGQASYVHASRLATCAVTKGEVYCWGSNELGELVTESTEKQVLSPSRVAGLSSITKVLVGTQFACALDTAGSVLCWGYQVNGRIGIVEDQKVSPPVKISLPDNAIDLGVGAAHACAILKQGDLYCWGWGEKGQLGNGVTAETVAVPAKVEGLSKVKSVILNRFGSCIVDSTNKVSCWGGGEFGQNGNSDKNDTSVPKAVLGLSEVRSLSSASAYTSHMCAIETNRTAKCWGYGFSLQLGNSVQGDQPRPVRIFETAEKSESSEKSQSSSSLTDITILCKKGSQTKVLSGVSPKCPKGFQEAVKKKPRSIFYLDLKKGCYSANFPVSARIATTGRKDYKTLYQASCTTPYHFQVIYSGRVPTPNNSPLPTQETMRDHCLAEYEKVMKRKSPTTIIAGETYLGWFFPDAGIEARQYPKKGICYIWKWDTKKIYGDAPYAESVSRPLAQS